MVNSNNGLIEEANERMATLFARAAHTMIGVKATLLIATTHKDFSSVTDLAQYIALNYKNSLPFNIENKTRWFKVGLMKYVWKSTEYMFVSVDDVTASMIEQDELKNNELLLTEAQRVAQIGHWEWNIKSGGLRWSNEIYRIFDLDQRDFTPSYERFLSFIPTADHDAVNQAITLALKGEKPYAVTHRIITSIGKEKFVQERGTVYRDEKGEAVRMVGTVHDITQRMEQENKLQLFMSTIEHNPFGIAIVDANGVTKYINHRFTTHTGFADSDILGFDIRPFLERLDGTAIASFNEALLNKKSWRHIIAIKDSALHDMEFAKQFSLNPIDYSSVGYRHMVITIEDITDKKRAEDKIWQQANFDSLTGIANRRRFNDRLTNSIQVASRENGKFSIFYIDLDHFKPVNDLMGHEVGDKVLIEVGGRLKTCIKREVDLVARLGGDEFAVILHSTYERSTLESIAEKMVAVLSAPYLFNEQKIIIGCSIGIAVYPDSGQTLDDLLSNADKYMYQSKQRGRNTYSLPDAGAA